MHISVRECIKKNVVISNDCYKRQLAFSTRFKYKLATFFCFKLDYYNVEFSNLKQKDIAILSYYNVIMLYTEKKENYI